MNSRLKLLNIGTILLTSDKSLNRGSSVLQFKIPCYRTGLSRSFKIDAAIILMFKAPLHTQGDSKHEKHGY